MSRTREGHTGWAGEAVSRRRFLYGLGGAAAFAGTGLAGFEWPHPAKRQAAKLERSTAHAPSTADAANTSAQAFGDVHAFVTRPDLQPQRVSVTSYQAGAENLGPRFIFLATKGYIGPAPGQPGLMIIDRRGRLVWFSPVTAGKVPFDFNVQEYRGQPVITWWEGKAPFGVGFGTGYWAGSSYGPAHPVQAGDGLKADLHELNITSRGTALITAYQQTTADLSAVGGPKRGPIFASHAQEVDLATGKVLFDWDSLEHVPISESFRPLPSGKQKNTPYDYFHINSIAEMPNGNLLISARNTWALYQVDRSNGNVVWRLNGKKSDFTMGPGSHFYWQHHARFFAGGLLTVFDDGASPPEEKQSRGLLLQVDTKAMHVSLRRAYLHPAGFIAANQGSVQVLPDGRVFVGWGNQPYFTEFSSSGEVLLDGELPVNIQSYRAFTYDWVGRPADPPQAAARANPAGGYVVYASWNGATEIDRWLILGGAHSSSLEPVGSQKWAGFETVIAVNPPGRYLQAVALDSAGRQLGRSAVQTAST
jgi:hypothetical protein